MEVIKQYIKVLLVRDCREHRKQSFYLTLAAQDWQEVVTTNNVDVAVRIMEDKICIFNGQVYATEVYPHVISWSQLDVPSCAVHA